MENSYDQYNSLLKKTSLTVPDKLLQNVRNDLHLVNWGENQERLKDKSPHRDSSDLWVRYAPGGKITQKIHISEWYYTAVTNSVKLIFEHLLLNGLTCEILGGVLLTKLPPGKEIMLHTDSGWHVNFYTKFYIPIISHDKAIFFHSYYKNHPPLNGYSFVHDKMTEGSVYTFDNRLPHGVRNNSPIDRIMLIMCCRTQFVDGRYNDEEE